MTDYPPMAERPSDEEVRREYWHLRSKKGGRHGIIGGMHVLVDKYGIPWSEISKITHPMTDS